MFILKQTRRPYDYLKNALTLKVLVILTRPLNAMFIKNLSLHNMEDLGINPLLYQNHYLVTKQRQKCAYSFFTLGSLHVTLFLYTTEYSENDVHSKIGNYS